MNSRTATALCLVSIGLVLAANSAQAQIDRVYDRAGDYVSGAVKKTSSLQGVQLEKGGKTQAIAVADIAKIMFEGDPPALTKGREFAIDGQFDEALTELKKINFNEIKREVIKADAAFYLILCEGRLALGGRGKKDEAAANALKFAGSYRESWHFFAATKLLGDLQLALGDTGKAMQYYTFLGRSPSSEIKIESDYLRGLVHLKTGTTDEAMSQFEKVVGAQAQTPETARLQVMAKAGKAVGLARQGNSDEGIALVKQLISELNATDTEMAARIYNAQGAAYEAKGDDEGALLAYLHTHLMFSSQPDAHAEALQKLIQLWPKVGKPERAAAARQELQQRYPGI